MTGRKRIASILDVFQAESPESTEFLRILRNLNGTAIGGDKKAILITSAMLSEGKSLISAFLSMASAIARKKKTLLVDFDLRRPMIHRLFGLKAAKGVSDILMEGIAVRNVIQKCRAENLDFITAGKIHKNPVEILNSSAINRVFEEMKFYYDLILVDSPPLIPVMDPMLLLEELDGALMVIKAGSTNRDVIKRARDLLTAQKDKVAGVILNNFYHALPYYYNYHYYGYQYKSSSKT